MALLTSTITGSEVENHTQDIGSIIDELNRQQGAIASGLYQAQMYYKYFFAADLLATGNPYYQYGLQWTMPHGLGFAPSVIPFMWIHLSTGWTLYPGSGIMLTDTASRKNYAYMHVAVDETNVYSAYYTLDKTVYPDASGMVWQNYVINSPALV